MSDAKDPQDASLVDIFQRLFQAPGAVGRRGSQHAVFISEAAWQLLYNNIAWIICLRGGSVSNRGDKRVERKCSPGVRYRRYLFNKLQRRETALQIENAITELIISSSLHIKYGAQEAWDTGPRGATKFKTALRSPSLVCLTSSSEAALKQIFLCKYRIHLHACRAVQVLVIVDESSASQAAAGAAEDSRDTRVLLCCKLT